TPDWVWDAAIYQVFIDRFYPGDGKKFLKPQSPRGLYGGTLRGVIDKLDYLSDLGVNCIWLSPLFLSPSYHGYDIVDYLRVRPHLGTNQDLRDLVRLAHEGGIRVLLDFVPNHTSHRHPYFLQARANRASPYHSWFTFREWPDDYATFFTARNLPQINLENREARQFMLDSARYWLETAGIDGYRLDYADGPSHNFWVDFRRTVRTAAPECFTVGELVEAADFVRSYEGRLDGALDFLFLDAARRFFAFDKLDAARFEAFLSRHEAFFAPDFVRATFLDNHDMNRFLYLTGNDKARARLAAACQFTLPQPPVLYYGTEVGMSQMRDKRDRSGYGDAEARRPMPWDGRQDSDMFAYYKRLFRMRREHSPLRRGRRLPLYADSSGVLAYSLAEAGATVVVAVNNSSETRTATIPLTAGAPRRAGMLRGLLDKSRADVRDGAVRLRLAARSARVLGGTGSEP
ncbi:MAG: glycoside hydrolase family 13 protein, partial [Rudaea sp.]